MKLTFLGTRGNTEARTQRHRRHSSTRVTYYDTDVAIDCGEDWLDDVADWDTDAVVITHAHPDHAFGLKRGAPCPVFATDDSWERMYGFEIGARRTMSERRPVKIRAPGARRGITFEAFPLLHSTRAPAVGYRITAGRVSIFYAPDVAWIQDREGALRDVQLYVGDGASVTRSMMRKPGDVIVGHAPMQTQLTRCRKLDVPRAVFTHLGSEVVEGDEGELQTWIQDLAMDRDLEGAQIADDVMEVVLR